MVASNRFIDGDRRHPGSPGAGVARTQLRERCVSAPDQHRQFCSGDGIVRHEAGDESHGQFDEIAASVHACPLAAVLRDYRDCPGRSYPPKRGLKGTAQAPAGAEKPAEYLNITVGTLEHHEAGHTIL
jgi:hypothetical protein